jgi:AIG2-like family
MARRVRDARAGASEALPLPPVTLYAAYGTNLDPIRMSARCPHSPLRTTGWLTGWRLTFGGEDLGWDGSLTTIVEDPIEQVFVAVYDVTSDDEASLDDWESAGTGLYRKTKVRVSTMNGELLVWTYVLDAYEGGLPSAIYLGVLADAAEAADAPDDYVAALRRRPCRSVGL